MKPNTEPDPFRFLYYSGFWYKGLSSNCVGRTFRFVRSLLLTFLCICVFSATLHHTIANCKFNTVNASYPITCCWQLQQILNIVIIHYWQSSGSFSRHIRPILRLPSARKIQRQSQLICLFLIFGIAMFLASVVLVASRFNDGKSEMFSYRKIFNQIAWLYIPARLIGWYMILIFLIVNYYFHSSTGIVCNELKQFNKKFKAEFKYTLDTEEIDSKVGCEMARKMHDLYKEHLLLANKIRSLDKVFNVYTLVNAATTIPCTVFTLWTLFLRIRAASWVHVLLTLVELFLCLTSLLSLLTNPSKIRVQIRETRSLLFSSSALWQIYVPKVYDIARLFVAHLDQDELGISLWGLITISKSLTLSVVSVTVTFLVFLLELNGSSESKDFGGVISRLLDK